MEEYLLNNDLTKAPLYIFGTIAALAVAGCFLRFFLRRLSHADNSRFGTTSRFNRVAELNLSRLETESQRQNVVKAVRIVGWFALWWVLICPAAVIFGYRYFTTEVTAIGPDWKAENITLFTFGNPYGHLDAGKKYIVNRSPKEMITWDETSGKAVDIRKYSPGSVTEVNELPHIYFPPTYSGGFAPTANQDLCLAPAFIFDKAMADAARSPF